MQLPAKSRDETSTSHNLLHNLVWPWQNGDQWCNTGSCDLLRILMHMWLLSLKRL